MATGKVLITRSGGAIPYVVGHAAVLVPPADPDSLAKAQGDLLAHPERVESLGETARRWVVTHYSPAPATEMFKTVYEEAFAMKRKNS